MRCPKSCLLLAFVCTLLAASVSAAPVPPPPTGKITRIVILGSKNVPESDIRAALTEKIGGAYSPEAAEKDRAAVQALGFFRGTVAETATPDPAGGVALTYTVAEYPIVTAIKFVADTPMKEPAIPSAMLVSQMTFKVGQVLDVNALYRDFTTLFDPHTGYVTNQGYLFSVGPDRDIDPKTGVITIPLIEYHIQAVKVTGLSPAKMADVLTKMHIKPGDLYNSGALWKDLGTIYTAGFLSGGLPSFDVTSPGLITLTLPFTERRIDSVAALDESQGYVIPFLYDPITCLLPVIQVSIDGKPPLSFIVDTGTNSTVILAPWAVKALGLTAAERTQQQNGFTDTPIAIQSAVFQGKSAADAVTFNITQARVVDLDFFAARFQNLHIAGIIGRAVLEPVTTRFDFAAKTLTVFTYPHPPLRRPGATVVPLGLTSDRLYTVPVTLAPGITDTLILDTGAYSTDIHRSHVKSVHPMAISYTSGRRIEGLYVSPELRLPGLSLGTLTVLDVVVGTMEDSTQASLGLDILTGYRLTLDGPNRELTLEPSAQSGRYFAGRSGLSGWSGLTLASDGGGLSVKALSAWSPALRAGVQVGDTLLTINGQSVQGASLERFTQLISETRGLGSRPVQATLRRGTKTLTASWVPLNDFTAPQTVLYGLTLRRLNEQPWEVLDVLKGSPADRAGLQSGNRITDLTLPSDKTPDAPGQDSLPITVTRAGQAAPFAVTLTAPPQKK